MKMRIPYAAAALTALAALMLAAPAVAESTRAATPITIDLTPLFQAVIAMLAALVTAKVVPWIKQRTTAEQQAGICTLTRTLVYAAEQLFKNQAKSGDQKLNYVKTKLRERGFDIDLDAIEAAVMELNLSDHLQPAPEASQGDPGASEAPEPDDGEASEPLQPRTSSRAE